MTSVFEDQGRGNPHTPVALSPNAAQNGIADDGSDDGGSGLDLSFFLSVGASLGSLVDQMQADRDRRGMMQPPGNEQLFGTVTTSSGGTGTIDLGSVPQGRVWQVRRLVIGGVKVTTTATGSAYVFAQGAPPADLNITNCVDIFTTMPQGNTYGTHQLFLLPSTHLFVVFSGASAAQQYAAAAYVEDWAEEAFQQTFSSE